MKKDIENSGNVVKSGFLIGWGDVLIPYGDMHQYHLEFIEWAKAYDYGGLNMRCKAKHDEWQKLLLCEMLYLDRSDTLESNFAKVLNAIG